MEKYMNIRWQTKTFKLLVEYATETIQKERKGENTGK